MADAAEVLEDQQATLITPQTDDVDPDGSNHLEVPEPRSLEAPHDLDEFLLPSYAAGEREHRLTRNRRSQRRKLLCWFFGWAMVVNVWLMLTIIVTPGVDNVIIYPICGGTIGAFMILGCTLWLLGIVMETEWGKRLAEYHDDYYHRVRIHQEYEEQSSAVRHYVNLLLIHVVLWIVYGNR